MFLLLRLPPATTPMLVPEHNEFLTMKAIFTVIIAALATISTLAATYPTPPPTFQAKEFTHWSLKRAGKSRRADINIDFKAEDGSDDYIHLYRLDLQGTAYERGYGHGYLMAKGI